MGNDEPLRKDDVIEGSERKESSGPSMLKESADAIGYNFIKLFLRSVPRPGKISWHGMLAIKLMALAFLWGVAGKAIVEIFEFGWQLINW